MPLVSPARIPASEAHAWALVQRAAAAAALAATETSASSQVPIARGDRIPLQLHIQREAPGPRTEDVAARNAQLYYGSAEWSLPMERYLGRHTTARIAAERAEDHRPAHAWAEDAYVVRRLCVLLPAETVHAVIELRAVDLASDGLTEDEWHAAREAVAARYNRSLPWLFRWQRRIAELARTTYYRSSSNQRSAIPAIDMT